MSDSLQPHGRQPSGLLCPWEFPGKNTWVGCYSLLQGIFLTQGWNPCLLHLLHWQVDSLPLSQFKNLPVKAGDTGSSLVQQDPTCLGATKPGCHNYWAPVLGSGSCTHWAHTLQLRKLACPKVHGLQQEEPQPWEVRALQLESGPYLSQPQRSPPSSEVPNTEINV